jgi:hypothetical protein
MPIFVASRGEIKVAFDAISNLIQPPGTGWGPQLYSSSIQ